MKVYNTAKLITENSILGLLNSSSILENKQYNDSEKPLVGAMRSAAKVCLDAFKKYGGKIELKGDSLIISNDIAGGYHNITAKFFVIIDHSADPNYIKKDYHSNGPTVITVSGYDFQKTKKRFLQLKIFSGPLDAVMADARYSWDDKGINKMFIDTIELHGVLIGKRVYGVGD